jgi:hypothetical protein
MLPDLNHRERPASYSACRIQQKKMLVRLDIDPEPYGLHSARVGAAKYLETELKRLSTVHEDMAKMVGWVAGSSQPGHYAKEAEDRHSRQAAILKI